MLESGNFTNRRAIVESIPPVPVEPEKVVHLTLTVDEAKILKEAAYFYWSQNNKMITSAWWHNPTDLTDEEAAKIAQDVYDEYMIDLY